ncbi:protein kinase [Chloroflexota bacterium]
MADMNQDQPYMQGGMADLSGKFHLLELLGTGGFAEVYKAVRKEDGLTVALKLPRISGFQTTQFSDFLKEAEKWKRLNHPGIVKIIEYGEKPIPYIAMEYMQGGSLRTKVGSLKILESLYIAGQLAEALFYAHHMGMAHLDIKPENILFDGKGQAQLSDWGLSRVMLASSAGAGVSAGTLAYSAPEQVNPAKYGERDWQTDVWQFGATLYEMVTGALPFPSRDVLELMHRIMQEEPVPISKARPDLNINPELENLIMRCLRKDKKERFDDFHPIRDKIDILAHPHKKASLEQSPVESAKHGVEEQETTTEIGTKTGALAEKPASNKKGFRLRWAEATITIVIIGMGLVFFIPPWKGADKSIFEGEPSVTNAETAVKGPNPVSTAISKPPAVAINNPELAPISTPAPMPPPILKTGDRLTTVPVPTLRPMATTLSRVTPRPLAPQAPVIAARTPKPVPTPTPPKYTWQTFTTKDGLVSSSTTAIAQDNQGNMWFGTREGISRYDGSSWDNFTIRTGLVSNSITAIAQDNQGNMWFGTDKGVIRYDGTSWKTFTKEDGLADNRVRAIAKDSRGNMWLGTWYGVSRWDGSSWKTFTEEDGVPGWGFFEIAFDDKGNLWCSTNNDGVIRYDGSSWTAFTTTTKDGPEDNHIKTIAKDSKGNMWFGLFGTGISRYDGTSWKTFNSVNSPDTISLDNQGNMWFGSFLGITRFDGSTLERFPDPPQIEDELGIGVANIYHDRQGSMWVGTRFGIFVLRIEE